ncbi:MAG: hypothetical protein DRG09_03395 [Epsilonproteobacteria bacterium]|nr:MAG: hypothetical protein DRG09_03395 [Campylobacterota bacterium]
MKKIIIAALVSTLALTNVQAEETNTEICKTYINEAKSFQETMEANKIDEATFAFYKDNVVSNCGNIVSKESYKKDFFAQSLMKKDTATVNNCKTAIVMAHTYAKNDNKSPFIANAHKINVTDNCGTLVSKKTPAFCFFDVVDNSKEDLKGRCIASIEKAHATTDAAALKSIKSDVVANCGRLQARI